MTVQIGNKLNWLERNLPEGLVVDAAWLERHGYSRSLRSQYVSAGWLKQPARGIFCRPRGKLGWEQVLISLQTLLEHQVSVGGRTALELLGYAHYLPQSRKVVHLYCEGKLPAWLFKLKLEARFTSHNRSRFLPSVRHELLLEDETADKDKQLASAGFRVQSWGQWKWPLLLSAPERALLELLDELPGNESFHDVDVLVEGLVDLSPRRLQRLLEETKSVKVKRLFFFFADRHAHRWLSHLDRARIDLGKGKRTLVKGGKFDPKYQITVPAELIDGV